MRLAEVSEEGRFPKNIIASDNYRKSRMLAKGCPKLLKMVEKNAMDFDKSIETQKYSQRLLGYRERIKESIMTTRSKTNNTPMVGRGVNLDDSLDPSRGVALSGLNRNAAYQLKRQLILANKKGSVNNNNGL